MTSILDSIDQYLRKEEEKSKAVDIKTAPLLWDIIKVKLYPAEWDEVKSIIGKERMQTNKDLHNEVLAVRDILSTIVYDSDVLRERLESLHNDRKPLQENSSRQLLTSEINFFINSLRQHALKSGKNPDAVFSDNASISNKRVLDYANRREKDLICHSTSSSSSSSPRKLNSASFERPTTARRMQQTNNEKSNEPFKDEIMSNLNINNIDSNNQILEVIRDAFEQERIDLINDIKYLQACLDEESSTMLAMNRDVTTKITTNDNTKGSDVPSMLEMRLTHTLLQDSYAQSVREDAPVAFVHGVEPQSFLDLNLQTIQSSAVSSPSNDTKDTSANVDTLNDTLVEDSHAQSATTATFINSNYTNNTINSMSAGSLAPVAAPFRVARGKVKMRPAVDVSDTDAVLIADPDVVSRPVRIPSRPTQAKPATVTKFQYK